MFNPATVHQLQAMRAVPSVTITLPTSRYTPQNKQDPIRLRNLVNRAVKRLQAEFGKRETAHLVALLQRMAQGVQHQHNQDGLIMLASPQYHAVYRLPYPVPERVVIDDNFLTRDLVFAMTRTPLYWVLVLTEQPTRLYLGRRDDLLEVPEYGFPHEYSGPGAFETSDTQVRAYSPGVGGNAGGRTDVARYGGTSANPSTQKEYALSAFMREVDASLLAAVKAVSVPVVVVGLAQNLALFGGVTVNSAFILREVAGGHEHLSAHDLGKLVWPQARAALRERRRSVLTDMEQAAGQNRLVTNLNEAWQAAQDGRVATMIVREHLRLPAQVSPDGRTLTLLEAGQPDVAHDHPDAVDSLAEAVMQAGGNVVFVEDDELPEQGGLAMLTRY